MPIDGNEEKWACESCIRGHRSSSCAHFDRPMIRVRKPGRPLTTCPHAPGSCTCSIIRTVMMRLGPDVRVGCRCTPRYVEGRDKRVYDVTNIEESNPFAGLVTGDQEMEIRQMGELFKRTDLPYLENGQPTNGASQTLSPQASNIAPHSSSQATQQPSPQIMQQQMMQPMMHPMLQQMQQTVSPAMVHDMVPQMTATQTMLGEIPGSMLQQMQHHHIHNFVDLPQDPYISFSTVPTASSLHTAPLSATDDHPASPDIDFWAMDSDNVVSNSAGFNHDLATPVTTPERASSHSSDVAFHNSMRTCHCGPSCTCFGCAVHPFNSSTTSRLRNLAQVLEEEEPSDPSEQNGETFDVSRDGDTLIYSYSFETNGH